MRSSWTNRERYEFVRLLEVQEVSNPVLQRRYEPYKQRVSPLVRLTAVVAAGLPWVC